MHSASLAARAGTVVAVAALALTGCGNAVEGLAEGAVERAIENELGESADVSIGEDSFSVDTEEGSITAGAGSVPEDFPADVSLPDGEVAFSQRLETADTSSWSVIITSSENPTDLVEQVRTSLESGGFTVDEASEFAGADGDGGTILAEKGDLTVLVVVAGDATETTATFSVEQRS